MGQQSDISNLLHIFAVAQEGGSLPGISGRPDDLGCGRPNPHSRCPCKNHFSPLGEDHQLIGLHTDVQGSKHVVVVARGIVVPSVGSTGTGCKSTRKFHVATCFRNDYLRQGVHPDASPHIVGGQGHIVHPWFEVFVDTGFHHARGAVAQIPRIDRGILRQIQAVHGLPWNYSMVGAQRKGGLGRREDFHHRGMNLHQFCAFIAFHVERDVVHARFMKDMHRIVVAAY